MKSTKTSRPNSDPGSRPPPPTREQIAALAHAIWIDRGQPEGRDLDHWLEAERQLRGDVRQPVAKDEIPADPGALRPEAKLDPDNALKGPVEKALDRAAGQPPPRSPTSL